MRSVPFAFVLASLLTTPGLAQKRSAPAEEPTFAQAIETAQKAFEVGEHAAAVSALQAAIIAVHRLQRAVILEALPSPEGFAMDDVEPKTATTDPFAASIAALGLTVERRYRKGNQKRFEIEITANSPMVQIFATLLANPALIEADGGEIVEYGRHRALLKKSGDNRHDLTIVMNDRHIIKVTSDAMSSDELFAIVDQAFVDRMEKPLGK